MSKITEYFKKKNKSATNNEIVRKEKKKVDFYEDCLQDCRNEQCIKKKSDLKMQIKEIKTKVVKCEEAIKSCQSVVDEKKSEINNLQKKMPECVASSTPQLMFESFSNDFNAEQLSHLRSIGPNIRGDSTFVSFVVKYMYSEKLESLKTKSACGRKYKARQNKNEMTPQKKQTLQNIYIERIRNFGVDLFERNMREKQLNKLIKNAFINITKSLEIQNIEKETCRRLNFED